MKRQGHNFKKRALLPTTTITVVTLREFKAKSFELIEQVRKRRQLLRIIHHGQPLADIVPVRVPREAEFIGDIIGTGKILSDIVKPAISLDDIKAYRK